MKTSTCSALILLVVAFGFGCNDADFDGLDGSGNIVTEDFALVDFTEVEAESAFDVEITQSDAFSVTVRADDNVMDKVEVSKSGDTLTLGLAPRISLRNATLEAEITMPALDGVELSGASRAMLTGFESSEPFEASLSGASRLDGELDSGEFKIDASGASKVNVTGSATSAAVDASGASDLDLSDFPVDTAEVNLSGASEATLNVLESIDPVDLSGASRLRYHGEPTLGDVNTSGESSLDSLDD